MIEVKKMKIKFILRWFTASKYFGMQKEHIKLFDDMNDLVDYRSDHNIKQYEIYRQVI